MLKKNFFYFSIKWNAYSIHLNSLNEGLGYKPHKKIINTNPIMQEQAYKQYFFLKDKYLVALLLLYDMLLYTKIWRHIRGYPVNGQSTHTNASTARKNKVLLNFRVDQFIQMFGKKKRNIFPTLVQAEYTNRLWYHLWFSEWLQARQFIKKLVKKKKPAIPFDPVALAKGQANGYVRVGNASKLGKKKKVTNVGTIGVPLLFTRFLYYTNTPVSFPYTLTIADNTRKKMGRKKKSNKKK